MSRRAIIFTLSLLLGGVILGSVCLAVVVSVVVTKMASWAGSM